MNRSPPPPLRKGIEEVFGPADVPVSFGKGFKCELESRQRDIAKIHKLACGPFCFRSRAFPVVDIKDLSALLVLMERGVLQVDQALSARSLKKGDIMLLTDSIPFTISSESEVAATVLRIPTWWALQRLVPGIQMDSNFHLPGRMFSAPAIHMMAKSIFDNEFSPQRSARSVQMLAELIRSSLDFEVGEGAESSPHFKRRISGVIRYICQNIESEKVTPGTAALALRCSVRTIHKVCAESGTSFNRLLMDCRIHAAAYLLSTTKHSISYVAYATGFGSFSHFCRLFKTRMGQSASEYRRRDSPG